MQSILAIQSDANALICAASSYTNLSMIHFGFINWYVVRHGDPGCPFVYLGDLHLIVDQNLDEAITIQLGSTARCKQHMHRVPVNIQWCLHHMQAMVVEKDTVGHIIYTVHYFKLLPLAGIHFLTDFVAHELECLCRVM